MKESTWQKQKKPLTEKNVPPYTGQGSHFIGVLLINKKYFIYIPIIYLKTDVAYSHLKCIKTAYFQKEKKKIIFFLRLGSIIFRPMIFLVYNV